MYSQKSSQEKFFTNFTSAFKREIKLVTTELEVASFTSSMQAYYICGYTSLYSTCTLAVDAN